MPQPALPLTSVGRPRTPRSNGRGGTVAGRASPSLTKCTAADAFQVAAEARSYDAVQGDSASGSATAAPTTATTPPTVALAEGASKSAGPDTTRAAAYSGTGGGLPPYDANEAATAAKQDDTGVPAATSPTSMVPGVGLAGALAALAAVAMLVARRRSEK